MKCIQALLLVTALAVSSADGADAPPGVSRVAEFVSAFAKAACANDLEAYRKFLPASKRLAAEDRLRKMRESDAVLKALEGDPMVVLFADREAVVFSKPWRFGLLGLPSGDSEERVVSRASLYREGPDGFRDRQGREDARWVVSNASIEKLADVPNACTHWRNKYPEGVIHLAPDTPAWLHPPPMADIAAIRRIDRALKRTWDEAQEVHERIREVCGGTEVFEGYFPASAKGRKALVEYWRVRKQKELPPDEEIALIRRGLRGGAADEGRSYGNQYVRHVGMRHLRNENAIELLYYASYHPDLAGDAVYYGLSLLRGEVPDHILKRLVELALQHQSVGRILWAAERQRGDMIPYLMIPYLEPFLAHANPVIAERAAVFELALRGEVDYEEWRLEQTAERQRQALGEDLAEVRRLLDREGSGTRREMLDVIRRHSLFRAFDRSFINPLRQCASDDDPEVRKLGTAFLDSLRTEDELRTPQALARFLHMAEDEDAGVREQAAVRLGTHFIWRPGPEEPKAIAAMLRLSHDADRGVRGKAVYYGLSAMREKSREVIDRLIEIAIEDREANVRGRITWGLRHCTEAHRILEERAQNGDRDAAELLAEIRP